MPVDVYETDRFSRRHPRRSRAEQAPKHHAALAANHKRELLGANGLRDPFRQQSRVADDATFVARKSRSTHEVDVRAREYVAEIDRLESRDQSELAKDLRRAIRMSDLTIVVRSDSDARRSTDERNATTRTHGELSPSKVCEAARFGEAAGIITRAESHRVVASDDGRELRRLVAFRTVLERILRTMVAGREPALADLTELGAASRSAASATRLRATHGQLCREIAVDDAGVSILRLRLIDRAMMLLESAKVLDVKACPACGWFFLDTSKNGSRRWCSMSTCGASAKASRYYRRVKAERSASRAREALR